MRARLCGVAGLILLAVGFNILTANAAEIVCVDTYAKANWSNPDAFKALYPSGKKPTPSTCHAVLIRGEIQSGDADAFRRILEENVPFLRTVYLSSPGGSAEEAMKIGSLVRKYMLETSAPIGGSAPYGEGEGVLLVLSLSSDSDQGCNGRDCNCASACFLIWAAGVPRLGDVLGLHRPTNDSAEFANLRIDKAAEQYRDELASLKGYLTRMEVPLPYIDFMTDTASTNVKWLDVDEAKSLQGFPSSIAESILASCKPTEGQSLSMDHLWANLCANRKIANFHDALAMDNTGAKLRKSK